MSKVSVLLESLDPLFDTVGKLSKAQRIAAFSAALILLVGVFYYFSFRTRMSEIDELETTFKVTKAKLVTAQRNAMQLAMFREKIAAKEAEFLVAKRALPEKQEIPSLLDSISRSGQDAGLEVELFELKPESPREFYAEIPVSIRVAGNYHAVAVFFDMVSKLSRIVNIRDVKMTAEKAGESLETTCTAVTYKFIEPQPEEVQ